VKRRRGRLERDYKKRESEWQRSRKRLCLPEELRLELGEVNPDWVRRQLKELTRWAGEANEKKLTGKDIYSVLDLAFRLTGEQAFAAALGALHRHGLDTGSLKLKFRNLLRKPALEACVPLVAAEIRNGRRLQEAAEIVAARYGVESAKGVSFEAAVHELCAAYRAARLDQEN
jgi:hypothetical protein